MNILIVEDEGLLARRLQAMLQQLDERIIVIGVTGSIKSTVNWLQNHSEPDLLFMDIELSDGRSFDIFQSVTVRAPIIFTTAYDEFAIKAFKHNSIDYLLKPIKEDELKKAWEKFLSRYQQHSSPVADQLQKLLEQVANNKVQTKFRDRFLVKTGQKMFSVESRDIAYITIRHGVSVLATKQGQKFTLDYSLDQLEALLDTDQFFRANRQFIIASSAILTVHPDLNSKLRIELKIPVEDEIIVSRERASEFKSWMGG
ncbi:MAG TPA: LytTR family DNA-binding domain-containing protein [Flavisolibacter sp.]|nr:LytTR family DNA-binding domain-containing protein [Flavisolibacter sp.]